MSNIVTRVESPLEVPCLSFSSMARGAALTGGEQREIRCPADGTLVRTRRRGRRRRHRGRHRGRPTRVRQRPVAAVRRYTSAARCCTGSPTCWSPTRPTSPRAESLDTGKRLVESEYDVDDIVSVFRFYANVAAEDAGRVVDTGQRQRAQPDRARADRRLRPDHAVELPAAADLLEGRARAGRRQHLRAQAERAHAVDRDPADAVPRPRPACPPASATSCSAPARRPARRCRPTPTSTWSRSPAGCSTGKHLMAAAAETVKKVALELGGKNPNIVFADADLDVALDYRAHRGLPALRPGVLGRRPAGRAGVDQGRLRRRAGRRAEQIRLGGPLDEKAETGALISAAHRDKVEAYVAAGIAEGATLRCGGKRPDDPALAGRLLLPADGPRRLHVDDERACRTSRSGRCSRSRPSPTRTTRSRSPTTASTGSPARCGPQNAGRAERVAARLRMGTVWINDYHPYVPQAEWGGYKQSGFGRELGAVGLDEYRETKHIWHNVNPAVQQLVRRRVMAARARTRSGTTSSSAAGRPAARWPTG